MADWLAYKSERGQTYRQRGFESFYARLMELSGGNADTARGIIEQSKANNWAGIFPLKTTNDYGRNADNRVAHCDITSDELMRRCEERVRARLARTMAREWGRTAAVMLKRFNPGVQRYCAANIDRCFTGMRLPCVRCGKPTVGMCSIRGWIFS